MGAYEHGRSDLDVVAAAKGALGRAAQEKVVAAARHEALPCPATKLELVVHRTGPLARGEPGVELNLETGAAETITPRVDGFWFLIDLSVLRAHGRALAGPQPSELVAEPGGRAVLAALQASLDWHAGPDAAPDDAVLNACRALLFASERRWASKREAGEWARASGAAPPGLVGAAIARRGEGAGPGPDSVAAAAFAREAYRLVAARRASSRSGRRNS